MDTVVSRFASQHTISSWPLEAAAVIGVWPSYTQCVYVRRRMLVAVAQAGETCGRRRLRAGKDGGKKDAATRPRSIATRGDNQWA